MCPDVLTIIVTNWKDAATSVFSIARDFEIHSSKALQEPERHLSNPLNAFLLMKRFTVDWANIVDDLIQVNSSGSKTEMLHTDACEKRCLASMAVSIFHH